MPGGATEFTTVSTAPGVCTHQPRAHLVAEVIKPGLTGSFAASPAHAVGELAEFTAGAGREVGDLDGDSVGGAADHAAGEFDAPVEVAGLDDDRDLLAGGREGVGLDEVSADVEEVRDRLTEGEGRVEDDGEAFIGGGCR